MRVLVWEGVLDRLGVRVPVCEGVRLGVLVFVGVPVREGVRLGVRVFVGV